ncbi:PLP-dependent aspartate aminotransferase family protein [Aquitalea sp. LB_tupeE]|uniref:trans-sulfuration enzyme family protein n=1 Tax=Aquitalea sp. LB_tupeE TaxID=2748078 RepID=UPI0015BD11C6|nr:PLP-dependent aspartate aminotransferase family protein [Aquitalea sp. LB_tupeE]NWK78788.1 PLP-dependent transferase [Aquitalea sp. LB_tupeE]
MSTNIKQSQSTQAIHGGHSPNPVTGAIAPDISMSVNYACKWGEIGFSAEGTDIDNNVLAYQREAHPNGQLLEARLAILEGGEDAVVFASGIGAISGLLLHLLSPGDHLLFSDISYAGAAEFVRGLLKSTGVEVSVADMADIKDVESKLQPNTKIIYAETPCNPSMKLADIAALSSLSKKYKTQLVIDSTFATPVLTKPIELGADYVIHSLTKYIGGHGDALGGAVVGRKDDMQSLRLKVGIHLGATLSPFYSWLILRGLETLNIRMDAYAKNAEEIAKFLESHPFVEKVRYPGLPSHPQYELCKKQMRNGSGMIAFSVKNAEVFGKNFDTEFNIIKFATSLGQSQTLILYCDTADLQKTTFQLDSEHLEKYKEFAGDGFFRLSVGLESSDDLINDLRKALDKSLDDLMSL